MREFHPRFCPCDGPPPLASCGKNPLSPCRIGGPVHCAIGAARVSPVVAPGRISAPNRIGWANVEKVQARCETGDSGRAMRSTRGPIASQESRSDDSR
jgi:hypothetical protein